MISRWRLLAVSGLVLMMPPQRHPAASPVADRAAAASLEMILPGAAGIRELSAGACYLYSLTVDAGRYAELSVAQMGVDISLSITPAHGSASREIDRPSDIDGRERLSLLPARETHYRIDLCATATSPSGSYELSIDGPRRAGSEDRARHGAEAYFWQARQLEGQRNRTGRRRAAQRYRRAAAGFADANDPHWRGIALAHLAKVALDLDHLEPALQALTVALPLLAKTGERFTLAQALLARGLVDRRRGYCFEALDWYRRATDIAGELGNQDLAIDIQLNRAGALMYLGETRQALDAYRDVLAYRRWSRARPADEAIVLNRIGELYLSLSEHRTALMFLADARARAQAAGDARVGAIADGLAGRAYLALDQPLKAKASLDRSLAIVEALGDDLWRAAVLTTLGRLHLVQDRPREACTALERAFDLYRGQGAVRSMAIASLHLARCFEALGDRDAARARNRQALDHFARLGDRDGEAAARFASARLLAGQGELDAAAAQLDQALAWVEDRRSRFFSRDLGAAYSASKHRYYALEIDLLMRLHQRRPDRDLVWEALRISEKSRARSLRDSLREARLPTFAGTDTGLRSQRKEIWQRIEERETLSRGEQPAAETDALLRDLLAEADRIEAELRAQDPRYGALVHVAQLNRDVVRQLLDPDTQLLIYSLGEAQSYVWRLDRDDLVYGVLPGRATIERQARDAYELLTRSREPTAAIPMAAALRRLADTLIGPVAQGLDAARIVVVLDGSLHYLPFAALPDPRSPHEPLIAHREVVNLPSIAVLSELRRMQRERGRADKVLAVFADPVLDPNDNRLPARARAAPAAALPQAAAALANDLGLDRFARLRFAGQEARALLALAPRGRTLAALGPAANVDAVLHSPLGRFRYLHFATHGVINEKHPMLSGLLLSLFDAEGRPRNGLLQTHDVFALDLPVDLVVLSACQTALGKEVRGEGLVGLTRGFMYAGAPRVVVSLWNVDDRATAGLMTHFYRALLSEQLRPAAALRSAQNKLRQEAGRAAPFFWAGFVLIGDWR